MKRIISEELLSNIATYMDDDIREWCHDEYMGKTPEEFLKGYYLRLAHEQGSEAIENFSYILITEFDINIYDFVTHEQEDAVLEMYEDTNEYGTFCKD